MNYGPTVFFVQFTFQLGDVCVCVCVCVSMCECSHVLQNAECHRSVTYLIRLN